MPDNRLTLTLLYRSQVKRSVKAQTAAYNDVSEYLMNEGLL